MPISRHISIRVIHFSTFNVRDTVKLRHCNEKLRYRRDSASAVISPFNAMSPILVPNESPYTLPISNDKITYILSLAVSKLSCSSLLITFSFSTEGYLSLTHMFLVISANIAINSSCAAPN